MNQSESGDKPLITIITVVKNGIRSIRKTMRSVREQGNLPIEYIIIDGCSTDGTLEVIKKNQDVINFWISEPDYGIYDAMNKGAKKAKGEWIWFLNSDDYLYPGSVKLVIDEIKSFKGAYDIVYGCLKKIGNGYHYIVAERNLVEIKNNITFNHPSTLIKKIFFNEIGGFDLGYSLNSDYNFFCQAAIMGSKIHHINKVLTEMSHGGVSEQLNNFPIMIKERFIIDKKNLNIYYAIKNVVLYVGVGFIKKSIRIFLEKLGLTRLLSYYFKKKYNN